MKRLQQQVKSCKINDAKVLEYYRDTKKYSATQLLFQRMQLRNAGRKRHGRRYTPQEKSLCLGMYKSGPRSYRFKEERIVILPSKSTLARHRAKFIFDTGINSRLLKFIKNKVKDWPETDLACTISFDETALKTRLDYNSTKDEIDGFVTLEDSRRPIFATHALNFMVRGINVAFKQPLTYYHTHGLKAVELAELLILVTEAVLDTGNCITNCLLFSSFVITSFFYCFIDFLQRF